MIPVNVYVYSLVLPAFRLPFLRRRGSRYSKHLEKTVINKRGETKQAVLDFIEEVYQGSPTNTLEDLCGEFIKSTPWTKFSTRNLTAKTFRKHLRDLVRQDMFSDEQKAFINSCKSQHNI
jgi:hypothetical protein